MPFSFRKSVRLGGGMRMNFSKSGVGFSAGTRGCRVSTGPRGTYINMGMGGISYRQKIGSSSGQSFPAPSTVQTPYTFQAGTPIPNASADQLVDANSAAVLERLNTTIKQPVYAWAFIVGGVVLGFALSIIHPVFFFLILASALYFAFLAHNIDNERRTYSLDYNLDDGTRQRWVAMNTAYHTLAKAQALWRITTLDHTYDWKRNAGASSLLNRVRATLLQQPAIYIASNLTPYCLHIGNQHLFFFPDRVYIYQNGTYGAVEYDGLGVNTGETRFIESNSPPSDAQVVGSTWQYVNKNGGPDRRFNNNHQLPIANYGVVELQSASGLNVLLHVSSLNAAHQFGTIYQQSRIQAPQPTSQQQARSAYQPPLRPQQQRRPSSTPPPLPLLNCYQVLDLTPQCTKEEASAKYRQLANSYHPDRVHNLAPEFKALAHQKMTEINNAVAELKRLRGW